MFFFAVQSLPQAEHVLNFSDAEELINDAELADLRDEALEQELAIADSTSTTTKHPLPSTQRKNAAQSISWASRWMLKAVYLWL